MEGRSKATYFRIDRLLSQIRASALKSNFNSETFEEPKLYLQYSTDLKGSCYILNIFSGYILNIFQRTWSLIITQAIVSTMKAPEQHVLQQPRPCSWVSVSVDVDSGVHGGGGVYICFCSGDHGGDGNHDSEVGSDDGPPLMVMLIIVAKREKFQTFIC